MCVAGAAASERGHKDMAFVHSKVRNKLGPEKVNDLLYVQMNLQFLEQTVQDNFGNEQVFSLDDEDEEDSSEGELFGQMDDEWINSAQESSCESVTDEVVKLSEKRQKDFADASLSSNLSSKYGWMPDYSQAHAKLTSRGRTSQTPARFLPEARGGTSTSSKSSSSIGSSSRKRSREQTKETSMSSFLTCATPQTKETSKSENC